MAKKTEPTESPAVRVKNNTTSIVSLPRNTPADLAGAAMSFGARELAKTSFIGGNETFMKTLCQRPADFVVTGDFHAPAVELKPGQEGEVYVDSLLPRALAEFKAMTAPGGSLTVCS